MNVVILSETNTRAPDFAPSGTQNSLNLLFKLTIYLGRHPINAPKWPQGAY